MVDYPEAQAAPPSAGRANPTYAAGPPQYLRKFSLVTGTPAGDGIDFAEFHCTFHVVQNTVQSPNTAEVTIFNVSDETINMVKNAYTRMSIQAGYANIYGTIFSGTIKQVRFGRYNGADSYMEIAAADADIAYNFATITVTLAAGASAEEVINACATALAPYKIVLAPLPSNLPLVRLPRGSVYYGMVRDVLRNVARLIGCTWSFVNGKLIFIPQLSYIEGETVVLDSATGLIGIPEQTQYGVMVRCLLNPNLYVGRRIYVDNKSIRQGRYNLSYTGFVQNAQLDLVSIAADGYYKILAMDMIGDSRGQPWYCELTCQALDATLPIAQAAMGRALPPSFSAGNPP